MILFNDVCSIINTVFYLTKKYHLMILFLIVIGCIVFCSHLLYIWYRVPHKSVTFTTNVVGCIGNPKCKIIALMNYGNEKTENDSIGFALQIYHPFREHSPYLFKGNMSGTSSNLPRRKRYYNEYESLCHKYASAIDSISTVYKSKITVKSNLYDTVLAKTGECWSNNREVAIWNQPIVIKDKSTTEDESWFYLKRKLKTWENPADTAYLGHGLLNTYDNLFPKWTSRGDVSKLKFDLKLEQSDFINCNEVIINFNGPYSLYSITIEPDEKGYDYIRFTNPYKLEIINRKGLNFMLHSPYRRKCSRLE